MIKQLEIQEKSNDICIKSIEIALNSKCNLCCEYCGAYNEKHVFRNQRLSVDEILIFLDSIDTLERVKLSGGEVTMDFPECLRIGDYCKERNLFYQINTNATLLTHDNIIELKNAGLSALHISLNFLDKKTYSQYYNVSEELYEKIISNIMFGSKELECVVETLLFDKTIDNLIELDKFIYSLGASGHEIQYGINQSRWENGLSKNVVEKTIFNLCMEKPKDFILYFSCFEFLEFCKALDKFEQFFGRDDIFFTNCIEGKQEFHLSDNGDIVSCELIDVSKIGNIYEGFEFGNVGKLPNEKKKELIEICYHCPKKFYFL